MNTNKKEKTIDEMTEELKRATSGFMQRGAKKY